MQNKVIIITGASDGIGAVAAKELSRQGATVVVVGRSPEKTKRIAHEIDAHYYTADFAVLDEVRTLAAQLNKDYPKIDILINNAGGVFGKRELTVDGHEKTIQVNHLAPFLLTNLLIDTLIKSKATIINTSSVANTLFAKLDINDLDLVNGYSSNRAYGNAKLANILFTQELHRQFHVKGISAVAVHPGNIATNFANDTDSPLRFLYRTVLSKFFLKSPEEGAEPLIWLATSVPDIDWVSGAYYDRLKPGRVSELATEPGISKKLWETSLENTKLT